MKKYLVLMICSISLTGNVAAQQSAEQKAESDRTAAVTMPGIGPFAPQS